ncbi:MAG: carbamate kinase [Bacillota bacterium]|nr:carbamate kinase [Bacillota bacterium]
MSRIVIALGGNALGNTPEEQQEKVAYAAKSIVSFVKEGHEVIIGHGNGPQVGMINNAMDFSSKNGGKTPAMPFPECGAMSQGYIGYHLQNAICREMANQGIDKNVLTVVTQVKVSKNDKAFENPTKPIGSFVSEQEAKEIMLAKPDQTFKEDAGRGWRRVVPSPLPIDIVEKRAILELVKNGNIVIACGGGGIPVVKENDGDYKGVAAVIDKDFASEKLAELVDADYLFILTAVDRVCINFNKPDQKELKEITVEEAEKLASEGHFAPGSMLPKVVACKTFASSKEGRKAIIVSLEKANLAMQGESGTIIK